LISGGLGALGLMFAEHLAARSPNARFALLGRSAPSAVVAALGGSLVPVQVDITDCPALERTVADLRERFGPVRGVIHAAGIVRDALVRNLASRDIVQLLGPKAQGARNLDDATRDDPLDWFVSCSSLVGEVGSLGQAAYAYANGWLDAFAARRAGP